MAQVYVMWNEVVSIYKFVCLCLYSGDGPFNISFRTIMSGNDNAITFLWNHVINSELKIIYFTNIQRKRVTQNWFWWFDWHGSVVRLSIILTDCDNQQQMFEWASPTQFKDKMFTRLRKTPISDEMCWRIYGTYQKHIFDQDNSI